MQTYSDNESRNTTRTHLKRVVDPYLQELIVDLMTRKLLADENLAVFFEGVDMDAFESHQYRLLQVALTNIPLRFPEHILHKHHRLFVTMGLNEHHFDQLMAHLRMALAECNVPYDAVIDIMSNLLPLREVFQEGGIKFTKVNILSESLGGEEAVDAAMEQFAWHVSEDKNLREILEGYDIEQIKEHQRRFFRLALTGFPESVNVQKYLRGQHSHLFERGLNVGHFDSLAHRFIDTLQSLRAEQIIVDKAKEFLRNAREAFEVNEEVAEDEKASFCTTGWFNAGEL